MRRWGSALSMHGFRITISAKVSLTFTGLAFAVSVAAGIVLYRDASAALRQEVRNHLRAIAVTTALQIDPKLHEGIRTRSDESTDAYQTIKSQLASVRKANPSLRYIYTMRRTSKPNVLQFVVDAESDPKLVSHVGDEYDVSKLPEMMKAFNGAVADKNPTTDEWGTFLSGYAPIYDTSGQPVAIVGVDMSLSQLIREESSLRIAALRNVLLAFLLSVILSLLFARPIIKPTRMFIDAAQRVRNGELDFQMPDGRSDEIGEFARAFNEMIAGLREMRDRLIEGSSRDFLTGLYNHMYFHERLDEEVRRAHRFQYSLSVQMIDLDRFKSINDTFGHPVGDSILRQLAAVLRSCVRDIDVVVRYGGDEFAVILPQSDKKASTAVAERIRTAVESHKFAAEPLSELLGEGFVPGEQNTIGVTVSIGVATHPEDHGTKDGIVMAADIALFRAKNVHRNSVHAYDSAHAEGGFDPQQLYDMLHDPNGGAVQSLAAAMDARDRYTCGHSERVADYAQVIASAISADQQLVDALRIAGLLHDLGKIGVPDRILNKQGSLTQEERTAMQQHPRLGANILSRAPQLDQIIPAVTYHHERWDGSGYPDGLAGKDIPLIARILAIADAFDAMTSDRPYRRAMSAESALIELQAQSGKQFDGELAEAFIARMLGNLNSEQAA